MKTSGKSYCWPVTQVLINAQTVHVGTGTDFFGNPTNQKLAGNAGQVLWAVTRLGQMVLSQPA